MPSQHTTGAPRERLSQRLAETSALRTIVERTRGPRATLGRALGGVRLAGWLTLGLGVLTLVAGAWFGWRELLTLGGALLTAFVVAGGYMLGRHPYEVNLNLSDRRVVVGDQAMAGVTVANTSSRPVLAGRVEVVVGAQEVGYPLPALAGGALHEEVFAIPTRRRGVVTIGPVRTVRGDPLGFMRRAVAWGQAAELYVHPRTVRLAGSAAGFVHDLEGRASHAITSADLAFHALREYVPGDDRRYVHWRTTARTGKLMVRQFEETRRSHVVVGLSRSGADYGDAEELETAVSTLGSIALEAMREDTDLTTLTSHEVLPCVSPGQLLDELTRLRTGRGDAGVVAMAQQVARDAEQASLVVLVVGSAVPADQLRAAGAVLPVTARVLAVQVVPEAAPQVTALGAVTVVQVAALDELRRTFRKAVRR